MIKSSEIRKYQLLWICVALFCAAFLVRSLHGLRYVTFGQDQARDAYIMSQFEVKGIWAVTLGPKASVGNFYLPPLYYQIHNLVSRASGENPLVMQWVIIVIESFTPVVLFLWLRLIVREKAALLGASAYAFSVGVIEYATFAWNPNMIPFFSTLAGYMCFLAICKQRKIAIPIAVIALFAAISLHFQAIVLVPFVALTFILSLKRDWKNSVYWVTGGMLASLMFVPYLLGEVVSHWHNTQSILAFFHENNTRFFDRISKQAYVFNFFPALIERFLSARNFKLYFLGRLLFFGGFLAVGYRAIRERSREKGLIIIYFLCIFIMLRVYKGDKVDYYMSTLYVLPAFLVAFLIEKWERVFFPILIVVAFVCGSLTFADPPQNGLTQTTSAAVHIAMLSQGRPVRLLFQDQDFVNLFAFGLRNQGVVIDQRSTFVIDVCRANTPCGWNGQLTCAGTVTHTNSVVEEAASHYKRIDEVEYPGGFTVATGEETVDSVRQTFPFYQTIGSAGTDTLLPQLYVRN